ncbi:hypothetical protein NDU88_010607 [Pleurodeles waltl]|uniref:Uncharacterized protein n=1 Tax=Pleurodeles waltl TaxID=8319 RepID=A0AAV7QXU7_PLEWA|nr:hypothetical protein NDU88_010607 [Pleurodeles waltl]
MNKNRQSYEPLNRRLVPCNGPLLPSTVPPYSEELHGSATPDPEVQYGPPNPLLLPGAEGQRQQLRTICDLKTESGEGKEEETEERRERSGTTEDINNRSREDATDDCGSETPLRGPDSSTSGARGAQRAFRPCLGKAWPPQVGGYPKLEKGRGGRKEAKSTILFFFHVSLGGEVRGQPKQGNNRRVFWGGDKNQ